MRSTPDNTHGVPTVITCHDLLAVRGALGEETDCPASFTGKFFQRWILSGLKRAQTIACVSQATLRDAERLIERDRDGRPATAACAQTAELSLTENNRADVVRERLAGIFDIERPFILHVGSNLAPQKSRRRCAHFRANKE